MLKIKYVLSLFILANVLGINAYAQGAHTAKEYDACYRLFSAMKMEETLEKTFTQMVDMQIKNLPQREKLRPVMLEFFSKYMGYESLKNDLADAYLQCFTVKDIEQLIEFYKTPVGQKFIKNQVKLTTVMAELATKRVEGHQQELQRMLMNIK